MGRHAAAHRAPVSAPPALHTPIPCALAPRAYRLIDALSQPHPQLDGLYGTLDEAWQDAIAWLECQGAGAGSCWIGMEVSTSSGDWRTIRLPDLLICPLPDPGIRAAF